MVMDTRQVNEKTRANQGRGGYAGAYKIGAGTLLTFRARI